MRITTSVVFILMSSIHALGQSLLGPVPTIDLSSERYQQDRVTVFGHLGMQDYQLATGGGPSVNISNSQITKFGLEGKWLHKKQNWGVTGSYSRNETSIKSPNGISPTSIYSREQVVKLALTSKLFKDTGSWLEAWEVGFGYWLSQRDADRTTPSDLISNQSKDGPFVSISTIRPLNETFNYSFDFQLSLVSSFRENSSTTGNYTSGYGLSGKFLLIYPTSRFVDLSLGLQLTYEGVSFYGTGQRGLTDAKETQLGVIVPLEIVIFF